ncbi:MAG: ABC transporter ATP-binding protein [Candidatus Omnitrophota bacterium]
MLEAKGIHKAYINGKKHLAILKGIDLSIPRGKFVAVVGPSGAGKSTLLHILGGLDSPTEGKVILEAENLYKLSDSQLAEIRNQKLGFVFQFYHLLPEFTVLENVFIPALINRGSRHRNIGGQAGLGARGSAKAAGDLLKQVGLSERASHFPNQLSGGEKQRVAIARALINRPQLLFCDEPTGNLDSKTGNDIIGLIDQIHQENCMTVVMVTHNLELAKIADQVYHLKDGILVN